MPEGPVSTWIVEQCCEAYKAARQEEEACSCIETKDNYSCQQIEEHCGYSNNCEDQAGATTERAVANQGTHFPLLSQAIVRSIAINQECRQDNNDSSEEELESLQLVCVRYSRVKKILTWAKRKIPVIIILASCDMRGVY